MIGYEEVPEDRLVIVTVDGKVTKVELRRVIDRFETFVAANKPVRILQIVRSLSGIEPAALWEDVTFSFRHLDSFSRAAVVTDMPWIEWYTRAVGPLARAKVRTFPLHELDDARDWLLAGGEPPAAG
jgi:hypothetical protein